ncbi:hypothetical protein DU475_11870 [Rhodopseudomonas sp. WA056]|nr:hypothetical protein [Rhodopseudomonas sp. WA056]
MDDHRDLGLCLVAAIRAATVVLRPQLVFVGLRTARPGGFSDIVKRRSIRVRVLRSNLRGLIAYLRSVSVPGCCKTTGL